MRCELVRESSFSRYEQFETSPETIDNKLLPAVCELQQTKIITIQYNTMQRNATHRTAPQRNAPQRNATQRNATQRNATQRNATQRNTTLGWLERGLEYKYLGKTIFVIVGKQMKLPNVGNFIVSDCRHKMQFNHRGLIYKPISSSSNTVQGSVS